MILVALLAASLAWTPPAATKTTDCHARGSRPDAACTPGSLDDISADALCRESTRARRDVPRSMRRRVLSAYGVPWAERSRYELDHLIAIELGGSSGAANLWPERLDEAKRKDAVENELHRHVCSGAMSLEAAQRAIATDWEAAE